MCFSVGTVQGTVTKFSVSTSSILLPKPVLSYPGYGKPIISNYILACQAIF